MNLTNINFPLSVLDFIHATENMKQDEFVEFAENLKQKLKELSSEENGELNFISQEVNHLINFIRQVCFYLYYRHSPGKLEDYDKLFFQKVIARYPLKD